MNNMDDSGAAKNFSKKSLRGKLEETLGKRLPFLANIRMARVLNR